MDIQVIKNGAKKVEKSDRQLKMMDAEAALQDASLAFEYTRLELEGAPYSFEQLELSEKLEAYKSAYFDARKYLEIYNPERLEKLEQELIHQKKEFFTYYSA
jgi:hypothetical protein